MPIALAEAGPILAGDMHLMHPGIAMMTLLKHQPMTGIHPQLITLQKETGATTMASMNESATIAPRQVPKGLSLTNLTVNPKTLDLFEPNELNGRMILPQAR